MGIGVVVGGIVHAHIFDVGRRRWRRPGWRGKLSGSSSLRSLVGAFASGVVNLLLFHRIHIGSVALDVEDSNNRRKHGMHPIGKIMSMLGKGGSGETLNSGAKAEDRGYDADVAYTAQLMLP